VSGIDTKDIEVYTNPEGDLSFDVVAVAAGKGHVVVSTPTGRFQGTPMSVVALESKSGLDGGKSSIMLEPSGRTTWDDATSVEKGRMFVRCGNASTAVKETRNTMFCEVEFQVKLIDVHGKPYLASTIESIVAHDDDDRTVMEVHYQTIGQMESSSDILVSVCFDGTELVSVDGRNVLSMFLTIDDVVVQDKIEMVVLASWAYNWRFLRMLKYEETLPLIDGWSEENILLTLVKKGTHLWTGTMARMSSSNNDVYCLGLLQAWISTVSPPFGLPTILSKNETTTTLRGILFKIIVDRLRNPGEDELGIQLCNRMCEVRMPRDNFGDVAAPSLECWCRRENVEGEGGDMDDEVVPDVTAKEYRINFENEAFELLFLDLGIE
jgi:hypothetical protein